ncbi:hypothetical protein C8A01DRAFT_41149 [Parachaetomium inaequale]|uniref:Uncharacterized protein n=1 Tax=Parachaetomium inaequale TaxID=2588326 RepID=A0AAN6P7T7_9PEZI|nr:hypothetical protein C8A01DRAFT_41149 [Parachaetomium inaequale]
MSNRGESSRRNTDPARAGDVQYRTSRGPLAARVVDDEVRRAPDPRDTRRSGYPSEYRNQEGRPPNTRRNFREDEVRDGERLYEVPVGSRDFDYDRRTATLQQVRRADPATVHRNDRDRVVRNPPNDPGPHRAVVAARPTGGPSRGPIGVISHPPDNPRGYDRATLEPIGRDGRAQQARHRDVHDGNHSSWPPRGETSGGLTRMETSFDRREPRAERRRRRDD